MNAERSMPRVSDGELKGACDIVRSWPCWAQGATRTKVLFDVANVLRDVILDLEEERAAHAKARKEAERLRAEVERLRAFAQRVADEFPPEIDSGLHKMAVVALADAPPSQKEEKP